MLMKDNPMRNLGHLSTVDLQLELSFRTIEAENGVIPRGLLKLVCLIGKHLSTKQRFEMATVMRDFADQLEDPTHSQAKDVQKIVTSPTR
jgi:hypothetical protein